MIYLGMSAAKQAMLSQALATHNLANVGSIGFKRDLDGFRAMPVFGAGHPSRVFTMAERPGIDLLPGSIEITGNALDIAINGDGFIAVLAKDGTEAYTRAGDLQITANGQLRTARGHAVLGNSGPIAVPQSETVVIGIDGTISVRPVGQEATNLAQVNRIKLVKPDPAALIKGPDGLLHLPGGQTSPPDADVRVAQSALERSNVNPVEQMINIISNARQYEMAVKAMSTAQELDAAGARLMHLGG